MSVHLFLKGTGRYSLPGGRRLGSLKHLRKERKRCVWKRGRRSKVARDGISPSPMRKGEKGVGKVDRKRESEMLAALKISARVTKEEHRLCGME